jgi:OmpA-OmpF porin, OOP family
VAEAAPVCAPAAPKVSAPAVAPVPQSYMVFFDFDKATLTPEAKRIIASAAQDFKSGKYVRLVITGHTDTMGSAKYNQKLSVRRANAVKEEFTSLGVPPVEIAAAGVGENGLMVPTSDQVREAQNRRAEIVFNK